MKPLLFFPLVFICSILWGYDTYFFRISINGIRTKTVVDSFFLQTGSKVSSQPMNNTFTYSQRDPNYVLVQVTPVNDTEYQNAKITFGLSGVDLWKQYHISENGLECLIDNSKTFLIEISSK